MTLATAATVAATAAAANEAPIATVHRWRMVDDCLPIVKLSKTGAEHLATHTSEIFKLADSETLTFATFTIAANKTQATLSWQLKILHLGAPFDANVVAWCEESDDSLRRMQQGELERANDSTHNSNNDAFSETTTRFDHANMSCKLVWKTPVSEQLCSLFAAPFSVGFRIQRACGTIEGLAESLVFAGGCWEVDAKTIDELDNSDGDCEGGGGNVIMLRVPASNWMSTQFEAAGASLTLAVHRRLSSCELTGLLSIDDTTTPIALSCSVELRNGARRVHSPFVGKQTF